MTKKPTTTANETVASQLANATLRASEFKTRYLQKDAENKLLKRQLTEANKVIEGELRTDLMVHIQAKSDGFSKIELDNKSIQELQQIDATLAKAKGVQSTYKNIRAAGDSEQQGNLTVGSLYGLTRKEILAKGGEF